MLNNELLNEISARIAALAPMANGVKDDVEKSIQDILGSTFSRLNLVTREEFETQLKVLEQAEATIASLEEKITLLEQAQGLNPPNVPENAKQ